MSNPNEAATTKQCEACGAHVTFTGHRGFKEAHPNCPKAGQDATDRSNGKLPCPTHGTLVWRVGPYSTFRQCGAAYCTAGVNSKGQANGKPWRYCAPRGENAPTPKAPLDGDARIVAEVIKVDNESPKPATPEVDEDMTPEVAPKAPKHPKPAAGVLNLKDLGPLGEAVQRYVDERAEQIASERITEALKDAKLGGPSEVEWKVNGAPFAKIDGTHHKALPRMLKLYAAGFRNFLIVGPAGSGKTTLCHDMARALSLAFGFTSCSAGMSESVLVGKGIPDLTTGRNVYQSAEFVRIYEGGGVFLLDEIDAGDANVMLIANSALANGHLSLPARTDAPVATRHENSVIVCAANTFGHGADRQYVGRNQLDAAFLDRFVGATIAVDYDRDLESALVGDANICARVWTIRDKVAELKLRRVVGTRFLLSVTRLVKGAGETLDAAIKSCCEGWTADEMSKVGVR